MNPYQNALKKKKFEGLKIEISPIDLEKEKQTANMGDGAPEVHDDPKMMGPQDTPLPISDEEAMEFTDNAENTKGIEDLDPEEVLNQKAPIGEPKSLRDRVLQKLKGKK